MIKRPEREDEITRQVLYAVILQALKDTTRWLSIRASAEEKVYVRRAQFRLNDLARFCERQQGVDPSARGDKEWDQIAADVLSLVQKATDARGGSVVGTGLARIVTLLTSPAKEKQQLRKKKSEDRREIIRVFVDEVHDKTGVKISKKDVWSVAGYHNPTEFERYQRSDRRTTESAKNNFDRVLNSGPQEFLRRLEAIKARTRKS